MSHHVRHLFGALVAARGQQPIDELVARVVQVELVLAVAARLVRQEEGRVRETEQRARSHLGVQLGAAGHADTGRHGCGQSRAVHVQQLVQPALAEQPRRVQVHEERHVQRGWPVPGRAEVQRQRVHGTPATVVPEHHVVPAKVAVAHKASGSRGRSARRSKFSPSSISPMKRRRWPSSSRWPCSNSRSTPRLPS